MTTARPDAAQNALGTPWVVRFQPRPAAAVRLLCLPHAGGGASAFRTWGRAVAEWIEVAAVQLPGREARIREPLRRDLGGLADELADGLAAAMEGRYALYGHSMGALLAFELVRRLERAGAPLPVRLFVAGCAAPHRHASTSRLHLMDFDEVIAELRRDGATPAPVLDDRGLMARLVPILQADVAMCVAHGRSDPDPVEVPISAFGGARDTLAPPASVDGWRELTALGFRARLLAGGHFFPADERDALLDAIARDLAEDEAEAHA
jgi:medium-chain acyl-[acyl-carrier-protein] hydrolase